MGACWLRAQVSEQAALEYDQAVGNIDYDSLHKAHTSLYQVPGSLSKLAPQARYPLSLGAGGGV